MDLPGSATIRTRTAPPDVRRQQLIEATIVSISQNGISNTTMTTITQLAGLSLGLVNFHFKSKEALLTATLLHLAEEHRCLWMTGVAKPKLKPALKILAIVKAQFHPQICNRKKLAVWFAFFGEAAYRKSYRSSTTCIDAERRETLINICSEIISEGDYTAKPEEVANTLEAMFDGFWLNMLMYPDTFTGADSASQIIAYLAHAFPFHFAKMDPQ